jgi:hypothetical protein
MEITISISGKVTIPEDDLKMLRASSAEDLATVLVREGRDVKTEVREVYEKSKGGK